MGGGYSGEIEPRDAWDLLKANPNAQLIDVRTIAEWTFVGLPDLTSLGRRVVCVEWQTFPDMARNADFEQAVDAHVAGVATTVDTPLIFLCRSGARSRAAAIAMTKAGRKVCWNLSGGFEGDLDPTRHRGSLSGWKAQGLPWYQS